MRFLRNGRVFVAMVVALSASALAEHMESAEPQTPAKKRLAEVAAQLEEARNELEAARERVAKMEEAVAEAKTAVVSETVERARRGDPSAFQEVLDGFSDGLSYINYHWAGAVSGEGLDNRKVVGLIRKGWREAASSRYRSKLCWLLGQNGSEEAAAELRAILAEQNDPDVLGNALAALRRCPRSPGELAAIRRHAGDERPIKGPIGFYPHSTLGEYATRFAREVEAKDLDAVPGEVVVEAPTLECLGFEWRIQGDSNENCAVTVAYRKCGATEWQEGFPFLRCENRVHPSCGVHPGNLLAGSIFDLAPGTEYEVRLRLKDPDGGEAEQVVTARTREAPDAAGTGRTLYVVPGEGGGAGTKEDPLEGLSAADAAAQPGDTILLQEGTYQGDVSFRQSGSQGEPIIYRGADVTNVIIDGQGKDCCLSVSGLKSLRIENLSFTNARTGLKAFRTEDISVQRCKFFGLRYLGILAQGYKGENSRNWYIADNEIMGPAVWVKGRKGSSYGISINGEGHVICYNRIENWWDCISLATNDRNATPHSSSIDIYGNDIRQATDDGVEADYVHHNIRIFRNRLTNTFSSLSFQPCFGGPGYLLRNAMYNTTNKPFKLHVQPTGMIIAHNTCVCSREAFYGGNFHHARLRNNLLLGRPGKQGYWMATQADRLDLDYSGYSRSASTPLIKLNNVRYQEMAAFRTALGLETHSVLVDWDVFRKAHRELGQTVTIDPGTIDLRLRPDSEPIDAGEVLPGINDGFAGDGPDLGCYEVGKPLPHYGPRPVKRRR